MQDLLASLASALNNDPVLATYALAWVVLDLWGAAALALAYRSRLHERAGQLDLRPHRLFPHR
jgi:tRNA U34 5-methylaminomethyl-2-thiouridine-forming methyltransferase MnmC